MEYFVAVESEYEYLLDVEKNPEKIKKYTQILNQIRSFLISSAYAAEPPKTIPEKKKPTPKKKSSSGPTQKDVRSWEEYASKFKELIEGPPQEGKCFYAGWVSRYVIMSNGKPGCIHPAYLRMHFPAPLPEPEEYKAYIHKGSDCKHGADPSEILCNPAVFGYKNEQDKTLFCVPAGAKGQQDAALNCMKEALSTTDVKADSPAQRLAFMKGHLEGDPKKFEFIQKFIYKSCICNDTPGVINKQYMDAVKTHQTCYGLMRTISEMTSQCTIEGVDTNLFKNLQSKLHDNLLDKKDKKGKKKDSLYYKDLFIAFLKGNEDNKDDTICDGHTREVDDKGKTPAIVVTPVVTPSVAAVSTSKAAGPAPVVEAPPVTPAVVIQGLLCKTTCTEEDVAPATVPPSKINRCKYEVTNTDGSAVEGATTGPELIKEEELQSKATALKDNLSAQCTVSKTQASIGDADCKLSYELIPTREPSSQIPEAAREEERPEEKKATQAIYIVSAKIGPQSEENVLFKWSQENESKLNQAKYTVTSEGLKVSATATIGTKEVSCPEIEIKPENLVAEVPATEEEPTKDNEKVPALEVKKEKETDTKISVKATLDGKAQEKDGFTIIWKRKGAEKLNLPKPKIEPKPKIATEDRLAPDEGQSDGPTEKEKTGPKLPDGVVSTNFEVDAPRSTADYQLCATKIKDGKEVGAPECVSIPKAPTAAPPPRAPGMIRLPPVQPNASGRGDSSRSGVR